MPTTPGTARAAAVSMDMMRAAAYGLCTRRACSRPGTGRSAVNRVLPVSRCGASLRLVRRPTNRRPGSGAETACAAASGVVGEAVGLAKTPAGYLRLVHGACLPGWPESSQIVPVDGLGEAETWSQSVPRFLPQSELSRPTVRPVIASRPGAPCHRVSTRCALSSRLPQVPLPPPNVHRPYFRMPLGPGERGFLPCPDPPQALPAEFSSWDEIGRDLPKLLAAGRTRSVLERLPA